MVLMALHNTWVNMFMHMLCFSYVNSLLLLHGDWYCFWFMLTLNPCIICYRTTSLYCLFAYRPVDFRVCWVWWFCPGTGFWSCNQIFDCDDRACFFIPGQMEYLDG